MPTLPSAVGVYQDAHGAFGIWVRSTVMIDGRKVAIDTRGNAIFDEPEDANARAEIVFTSLGGHDLDLEFRPWDLSEWQDPPEPPLFEAVGMIDYDPQSDTLVPHDTLTSPWCKNCGGDGYTIEAPVCMACGGTGKDQ